MTVLLSGLLVTVHSAVKVLGTGAPLLYENVPCRVALTRRLNRLIRARADQHHRGGQRVTNGQFRPVRRRGCFARIECECVGVGIILNGKAKIARRIVYPLLHHRKARGV